MLLSQILTAGGIMFGVALLFGVILAIANRKLRVEEDPRIDEVESMLPGSNCGACGQPGCRAFAENVVNGAVQASGCTVSSPEGIANIAAFLGVDAGVREKRVARLHCAGGKSSVRRMAEYSGLKSCRAAFIVNGGGRACAWGCLGLADCEVACTFDAISMTDEDLPQVNVDKCTACNDCVEACPLDLFTLEPLANPVLVQCASPLAGADATRACSVACDACGRCALDAADGAIVMTNGLPKLMSPSRLDASCTLRCPTGAITVVEGNQFQRRKLKVVA
ncbi:MAG: RnfABCDGE type electron transport complex subunit B [Polyangiaceae bacterium]